MPETIENILNKSKYTLVKGCLPELLGKFYTNYSPDEHNTENNEFVLPHAC